MKSASRTKLGRTFGSKLVAAGITACLGTTLSLLTAPAHADTGSTRTDSTLRSERGVVANRSVAENRSVGATSVAARQSRQNDNARYAAREAQSKQAEEYRGGDTVIIGATTATIVLAVILLIVLL